MTLTAYAHLRFAPDFAHALTPTGEEIRFSRRERALLAFFTRNAGKVAHRERLLGAITSQDAEVLDRNIDYIVSRLRRKLGDSTREPVFIATQYGEGYRWIASRTGDSKQDTGQASTAKPALLVIWPLRGLANLGRFEAPIHTSLQAIHAGLERRFEHAADARIILQPDGEAFSHCRFSLEISVLTTGDSVRVSSILREGSSGYIHKALQVVSDQFDTGADLKALVHRYVEDTHECVLSASMAPPAAIRRANQIPLEVALDQAAALFSNAPDKYEQSSAFLRRKLKTNPEDHHTAILLASNLHVAMVRQDPATLNSKVLNQSLLEMESLVIEHLGGIQEEPMFLSMAAKLLYFVGHHDLALELAEAVLDQDVSHASTLMMYAQLQMLEGDIDCALEYYDFALQHSDDDQFRSMILVLKATALRAQGNMAPVPAMVDEIVARDEDVRLIMHASLLGDQPECDSSVLQLAPLLPADQWQQLLRLNYYVNARLFKQPEHRRRLVEGLLQLAIRNAGPEVLFDELTEDLPDLCDELTQQAAMEKTA